MPEWLSRQITPENQLEESIEDNSVIVKRAFEKYIDEVILSFWRLQENKPALPDEISDRLVKNSPSLTSYLTSRKGRINSA